VRDTRQALAYWGVTKIVVPAQEGLGFGQAGRPTTFAIAYFTAITGSAPVHQAGAYVWNLRWPLPEIDTQLLVRFALCTKSTTPKTQPSSVIACMAALPPRA
jgi:hypothetical protein